MTSAGHVAGATTVHFPPKGQLDTGFRGLNISANDDLDGKRDYQQSTTNRGLVIAHQVSRRARVLRRVGHIAVTSTSASNCPEEVPAGMSARCCQAEETDPLNPVAAHGER